MMKNKLEKLFDYQKFAQNKKLQELIDESLNYVSENVIADELLNAVAGGKEEENKEIKNSKKNSNNI